MKVTINKIQRVTVGAVIGLGLFNPFTVAVLDEWFKLAYTVICVACAVWVAGFVLVKALKPEHVKTAPKGKKSKHGMSYELAGNL